MSRLRIEVDIAPAAYRFHAGPTVIQARSPEGTILAILDGIGSWGSGQAASGWVCSALNAQWQWEVPRCLAQAMADIQATLGSLPQNLRDEDFGCDFSSIVVRLRGAEVHIAAAGVFAAYIVEMPERREMQEMQPIYRPQMLLDQYVADGMISASEAATLPYQDIYVGPLLLGNSGEALVCCEPYELQQGQALVVAHHRLFRLLSADSSRGTWVGESALALQGRCDAASWPAYPVMIVRTTAS